VTRSARTLTVHAVLVGCGWFVLAFTTLVGLQFSPDARAWAGGIAPALLGVVGMLVAVAAVPLAWPVYIAIGWYEAGLADRLRAGDESARVAAGRVLRVQATVFAATAATVGMFALAYRAVSGGEYLVLAWLPLAVIALMHEWTARRTAQ
jgi:xanthosine utilization system XapX-like protein